MTNDAQTLTPLLVLRPGPRDMRALVSELFRARYMFVNLVRTAALVPYADMAFGVIWTLCRPLLFLAVIVFIKVRSGAAMGEEIPYALYLLTGLIAWWYFVDATRHSSRAVFTYRALITKVYLPRLIIPAVAPAARAFDLAVQSVLLVPFMIYFQRYPGVNILLLPLVLLHFAILSLALGYIFTSMAVFMRDVEQILDYVLYIAMFLSPVIYSMRIVPDEYRYVYAALNPVAGPLDALRCVLFAGVPVDAVAWSISAVTTALLLVLGVVMFRRIEDVLAERAL